MGQQLSMLHVYRASSWPLGKVPDGCACSRACCTCTEEALGHWTKSVTLVGLLQPAGEAPLEEQLAGLEERRQEEEVWGQALFRVSEGLTAGRRWLWDEASRKISVLLASPAAFAGEHFLQVCPRSMLLSDPFARLTVCCKLKKSYRV